MWMANLTIHPGCRICHSVGSARMTGTFYFAVCEHVRRHCSFYRVFYDGICIVNFIT